MVRASRKGLGLHMEKYGFLAKSRFFKVKIRLSVKESRSLQSNERISLGLKGKI